MKELIKVDGMMCEGCERRVNQAVAKLEGVTSCAANASDNQIAVEFDVDIISLDDIKETIEEVGYDVKA